MDYLNCRRNVNNQINVLPKKHGCKQLTLFTKRAKIPVCINWDCLLKISSNLFGNLGYFPEHMFQLSEVISSGKFRKLIKSNLLYVKHRPILLTYGSKRKFKSDERNNIEKG